MFNNTNHRSNKNTHVPHRECRRPACTAISVTIPVFNEEKNIEPLYRQLVDVLKTMAVDYEIIFINDGSTDSSMEVLKELAGDPVKTESDWPETIAKGMPPCSGAAGAVDGSPRCSNP